MAVDKGWVILLFVEDDTALLRLDTPLPLTHPKDIDRLVRTMIDVAQILELKDGEDGRLARATAKTSTKQKSLDIDEGLLSDDIGLELEEELENDNEEIKKEDNQK